MRDTDIQWNKGYLDYITKKRELSKTNDIISFNLSALEYRHAILGWCSFLLRPCIEPFDKLKYGVKFRICGEESDYICRVDDVTLCKDIFDAVTESNYRIIWPDGCLMTVDRVRYLAAVQVYNNRYNNYVRKYGKLPKVMLIRYSPYKDPKM